MRIRVPDGTSQIMLIAEIGMIEAGWVVVEEIEVEGAGNSNALAIVIEGIALDKRDTVHSKLVLSTTKVQEKQFLRQRVKSRDRVRPADRVIIVEVVQAVVEIILSRPYDPDRLILTES